MQKPIFFLLAVALLLFLSAPVSAMNRCGWTRRITNSSYLRPINGSHTTMQVASDPMTNLCDAVAGADGFPGHWCCNLTTSTYYNTKQDGVLLESNVYINVGPTP